MIYNAISRNLHIIKIHLIVFLFKSSLFFISLFPLKLIMNTFFADKSINENMFSHADLNAFHEFFSIIISPDLAWYGFPQYLSMLFIGIIFLFFLLFLIVDGFIDAGILSTIEKGKTNSFWKSTRIFGFSFVKLRLLNVILFLVILAVFLLPMAYLYINDGFSFPMGTFVIMAIPLMYVLKIFDHAKYIIIRKNKKAGKAFLLSIRSFTKDIYKSLILNTQVVLIFLVGYFIYQFIDDNLIVDSIEKIWLMVALQQATLFGKQILRYTYMTGVGNIIKVK